MRKYKILNNTIGWVAFAIAAITYLLTVEPTASFWDCPEFISQGFKLEVGHPPGNPIFMLAARFMVNFAPDITKVAICVNAMSALLSAGTILLLFWTITHLVKKLVVKDGEEDNMTITQMLVIFGSGLCGALVYTWSDTFWFSAVEAEVYAFSSFCTALVFWLILKWENRADQPHSDRYLILIAYVIGVSVAVHLLNLLCIPAIVLVFYYKKFTNVTVKGSLLALLASFAIIVLILYGLVPGFVEMGQYFELLFVNTFHVSYNTGVVVYALLDVAVFVWCIYELYKQQSFTRIKLSFFLSIFFSGMLFIGDSLFIPVLLGAALAVYLWKYCNKIPVRMFTIVAMSIFVIFIGYSSYAVILIRSNAQTPMDQNSPDNVFSLASYLNREQYGDRPLLYGQTFNSSVVYQDNGSGTYRPVTTTGRALYAKDVKNNPSDPDHYKMTGTKDTYKMSPELDMLFPRMYSGAHIREYTEWIDLKGTPVEATTRLDQTGNKISSETKIKPTFLENLQFFLDYQLNYMYWRYFMWNFVGRQNDIQGSGEITQGNWISGIPMIDNVRLGDQSLLPADYGTANKGHNVFYMLPLIFGIIGLLWQAYAGKKGIEQFWVVFFLFFMTGIAIVIYLNQTPSQPRERDYAYAGSFYAFAIWVGMGVAGLWRLLCYFMESRRKKSGTKADVAKEQKQSLVFAVIAAVIGLFIPLQMVSQTWDDHDRSGRYVARDFGMNYLASVDPNGIIFTNGDNDTFPLWYAQEVEDYRTDVRVINLSYLATDWYIAQMRRPAYGSAPVPMLANDKTFAFDNRQYNYFIEPDSMKVPVLESLKMLYRDDCTNNEYNLPEIKYPNMFIPVNAEQAIKAGVVSPDKRNLIQPAIDMNMLNDPNTAHDGAMSSSKVMSLDILASSIAQGWKRPVFFAMTVPDSYYLGLSKYMENTGMAYQVTPIISGQSDTQGINTDKMYKNIMTKFRWGGLDKAAPGSLYLDETVRRMVTTLRSAMCDLTFELIREGAMAQEKSQKLGKANAEGAKLMAYANQRYDMARNVLKAMDAKLPVKTCPYSLQLGERIAQAYLIIGDQTHNQTDHNNGLKVLEAEIMRYAQYLKFYQTLSASEYGRLSYYDNIIDRQYFPTLLSDYYDANEKGFDKLQKKLIANGVNLNRVYQMQEAIQKQQKAVQAQQQSAPQGGEENMAAQEESPFGQE